MVCKKRKLDKIKALLIVANSQKRSQKSHNRKEIRYYYCEDCKSFHVTSKKLNYDKVD